MAQRSIGLKIEILNKKALTDVEEKINELNKKGINIEIKGLDKLSNIKDLMGNIDKIKQQLDGISKSGLINQSQVKNDNQQIDETVRKLQQAKDVKGEISKTSNTLVNGNDVKKVEQFNQVIGRTITSIQDLKKGNVVTTTGLDYDKITNTIANIQKVIDKTKISMDSFKAKNEQVFNGLDTGKLGDSLNKLESMKEKLSSGQPVKFTEMTTELNNLQNTMSKFKTEFNQGVSKDNAITKNIDIIQKAIDNAKLSMDSLKTKNEQVFNGLDISRYESSIKGLEGTLATLKTGKIVDTQTITKDLNNLKSVMNTFKIDFGKGVSNENAITRNITTIQKAINSTEMAMNNLRAKNEQVFSNLDMSGYTTSLNTLKATLEQLQGGKFVGIETVTKNLNDLKTTANTVKQSFNQGIINEKATAKQEKEIEQLNNKLQEMTGTIRLIQQTNLFNDTGARAVFNGASGKGLLDRATSLKIDTSNLEQGKKELSEIETKLKNLQTNSGRIINFQPLVNQFKQLKSSIGNETIASMLGLGDANEVNNLAKKYTNLLNSLKNNSGDVTKAKYDSVSKDLRSTISDIQKVSSSRNSLQQIYDGISKIQAGEQVLTNLQNKINSINTKTPQEEITRLKDLFKDISSLTGKMQSNQNTFDQLMNSGSKGINTKTSQKAIEEYKNSSKELQNIMNSLSNGSVKYSQVQSKVAEMNNKCTNSLKTLQTQVKATDNAQKGFGQRLSQMASSLGIYMSVAMVMRKVYSSIREGITEVIALEDSMVSLQRVYNVTGQSVESFQAKLVSTSKQLGASATDYINAVTSFKKLGYDINESQKLATETTKFNLAGDINNMEEATKSVVSVLRGFKMDASEVTNVVDQMNTASNEYAVSASDLTDIMKKSSSSLSVYGNSLQESLSLGTVANEVMQDSSRVGRAFNKNRGMVA